MPKRASDVLREAKRLMATAWCKRSVARTRDGRKTTATSPGAHSFCIMGALERAVFNLATNNKLAASLHYIERAIGTNEVSTWNDTRESVDEAIAGCNLAIALAEAEEK